MMRILYVEDNQVNLMLVERVARMGGHDVINRTSGEAALADFDEINPDLILMDIQLEGEMTGLDAVRALRQRGVELPIVALTAYAMKGDREKALAAGCNQYLPKPLPINVLLDLLKKYEAADARNAVLSNMASTQQSETLREKVKTAIAKSEDTPAEASVPPETSEPAAKSPETVTASTAPTQGETSPDATGKKPADVSPDPDTSKASVSASKPPAEVAEQKESSGPMPSESTAKPAPENKEENASA
ncbi:MAG: response regulator [Chloroflexota bacterium]